MQELSNFVPKMEFLNILLLELKFLTRRRWYQHKPKRFLAVILTKQIYAHGSAFSTFFLLLYILFL